MGRRIVPARHRCRRLLWTRGGRIELFLAPIAADLPRLHASLGARLAGLVLVGRRHLWSNHSWMHNVAALRGGPVCTLQIHRSYPVCMSESWTH